MTKSLTLKEAADYFTTGELSVLQATPGMVHYLREELSWTRK